MRFLDWLKGIVMLYTSLPEVQVSRARRQPREAKSHYAGVMKMGVTLGVMDYTPSGV